MKKVLIITAIILATLVIVALGVVLFKPHTAAPTTPNNPVTFPSASSTTTTTQGTPHVVSIPMQNGLRITTKNFIDNGTTIPDVENQGNYLLAGSLGYCLPNMVCEAASSSDFNIFYDESTGTFTVGLLKEPLGAVRHEAELFLQNTLGLTPAQLCGLNYYVGTTYTVNEKYSGGNLGFSTCAGATPLPK